MPVALTLPDARPEPFVPAGLHDGYSVVRSLPVTYKVLGFRRTVDVPFDMAALSVHAHGMCDLPLLPWR